MRNFGQTLAIAGILLLWSPGWLPFDVSPWAVRAAALGVLLCGLVIAVLGSVLDNLPERARMEPLPDDAIPGHCLPLVEQVEALGFRRLGPALRVHLQPKASIVPLWHEGERAYATVFGSDGAAGRAFYDFVTVFEPGDAGLTSAANVSAGVLPQADGSFLQIFPGAEPADLLPRHLEARDHLAREGGLRAKGLCASFEEILALALRRQREAFLRAPLRNTWVALWRVLAKRSPAARPLASQPATRARLEALADPFSRAKADEDALQSTTDARRT
jgi:hypothetical protein